MHASTHTFVHMFYMQVLEGIIRIGLWFFGYLTLGIALIVLTRRCDWLRGSYIAPENR